jgi:hypothetical protein
VQVLLHGPVDAPGGSLRAVPTPPLTVRDLADRHSLELRSSVPGDGSATVTDAAARPVLGVSLDSRRAGAGQLWAALPGGSTHGGRFAAQALDAGAVAVLTDAEGAALVEAAAAGRDTPLLVTGSPRELLGPVAADLHGRPSEQLALVGVTGTNGKTTVSTLVDELLRSLGATTGLIGTIRSRIGAHELASSFTTPEAPDLQALLRQMVEAGCTVATTEVSSHALAQHRVDGTRFALVVFTNLSRDHLDFHGTLAAYFAAKLRLFTGGFAPAAVVAVDDAWGRQVAVLAREAGLRVLTVGTVTGPPGRRGNRPGRRCAGGAGRGVGVSARRAGRAVRPGRRAGDAPGRPGHARAVQRGQRGAGGRVGPPAARGAVEGGRSRGVRSRGPAGRGPRPARHRRELAERVGTLPGVPGGWSGWCCPARAAARSWSSTTPTPRTLSPVRCLPCARPPAAGSWSSSARAGTGTRASGRRWGRPPRRPTSSW